LNISSHVTFIIFNIDQLYRLSKRKAIHYMSPLPLILGFGVKRD
jgi:hypothetical protein